MCRRCGYSLVLVDGIPAFDIVQDLGINITHIESRPSKTNPGKEYDFFVEFDGGKKEEIDNLVARLKTQTTSIIVHARNTKDGESERPATSNKN